jgi:hypothetical protein
MVASGGIDRRHYFGGGRQSQPQVVYQTVNNPAPSVMAPTAAATAVPAPPDRPDAVRADAARRVGATSLLAGQRRTGRVSTIIAPRGTLEDQVKSLLGG